MPQELKRTRRPTLFRDRKGPKFGDKPKKAEPEAEPMEAVMMEEAVEMPAPMKAEVIDMEEELENSQKYAETVYAKATGQDNRLEQMLADLETSKKGGSFFASKYKKDSKEFVKVKDCLRFVVQNLEGKFGTDVKSNEQMMLTVSHGYYRLVNACSEYLQKKGGSSDNGKARKEKVALIMEQAKEDITGVQEAIFSIKKMSAEEQSQLSWADILHSIREATIEVDDITKFQKLGAGVKTGDSASRMLNSGIFTPETIIDLHAARDTEDDKMKQMFSGNAFNEQSNGGTAYEHPEEQKTLKLSERNVAMSRVANLLGIGNVVEQSKTVKVHDKKTGKTIKGNLMTKAKGTEALKELEQIAASTKKMDSLKEREETVAAKFAPSVQKELSSLQVLDYICGQGDRNQRNFFFEKDEKTGQFTHVHGIDNDMAFGSGVNAAKLARKRGGTTTKQMQLVVDEDENLLIPHMDKQLAVNVLNLSHDELRFALKDLIEPAAIEATIKRLTQVQNAIRKEMAKPDSTILLEDGQWNEQTHKDFLDNSGAMKSRKMMNVKEEDMLKGVSMFGDREQQYQSVARDSYYAQANLRAMGHNSVLNQFVKTK